MVYLPTFLRVASLGQMYDWWFIASELLLVDMCNIVWYQGKRSWIQDARPKSLLSFYFHFVHKCHVYLVNWQLQQLEHFRIVIRRTSIEVLKISLDLLPLRDEFAFDFLHSTFIQLGHLSSLWVKTSLRLRELGVIRCRQLISVGWKSFPGDSRTSQYECHKLISI